MPNIVVYKKVGFYIGINCKKTFTEFFEHESHHGFSQQEMFEVYKVIKQQAGMIGDNKKVNILSAVKEMNEDEEESN